MHTRRPLRVALVEEVELIVQGLGRMLEPYGDRVEIVADEQAQRDITLVDVQIGPYGTVGPVGPVATAGTLQPGLVVVWAWNLDPQLVRGCLDHGVAGYLSKRLPAEALVSALEQIHAGQTVVSDPPPPSPPAPRDPNSWPGRAQGLTSRESEIIRLIARGLSNQQIADRAYLSINSVKSYIRSSYRKMGVTSRSRAVLWGIEHGFHEDDPRGQEHDRPGGRP